MINLTQSAINELKDYLSGIEGNPYIRIGCKAGGCNGYKYIIDIDLKGKTEFDSEYIQDGITILIDKKSESLMNNLILDYISGLFQSGFQFINKNSTGQCGCGESFSV